MPEASLLMFHIGILCCSGFPTGAIEAVMDIMAIRCLDTHFSDLLPHLH
jgi:hypothetical protein